MCGAGLPRPRQRDGWPGLVFRTLLTLEGAPPWVGVFVDCPALAKAAPSTSLRARGTLKFSFLS